MRKVEDLYYTYDPLADALSINERNNHQYEETIELNNNIFIDLDKDENPIGVEILDASIVLNVNKFSLKKIKCIQMKIEIKKEFIYLKLHLKVESLGERLIKEFDSTFVNDFNLPLISRELATI